MHLRSWLHFADLIPPDCARPLRSSLHLLHLSLSFSFTLFSHSILSLNSLSQFACPLCLTPFSLCSTICQTRLSWRISSFDCHNHCTFDSMAPWYIRSSFKWSLVEVRLLRSSKKLTTAKAYYPLVSSIIVIFVQIAIVDANWRCQMQVNCSTLCLVIRNPTQQCHSSQPKGIRHESNKRKKSKQKANSVRRQ